MVFHWSLSDSKSLQVPWTLLNIQADLNNDLVYIVSICPPPSYIINLLFKYLVIFWEHQLQLVSKYFSLFSYSWC